MVFLGKRNNRDSLIMSKPCCLVKFLNSTQIKSGTVFAFAKCDDVRLCIRRNTREIHAKYNRIAIRYRIMVRFKNVIEKMVWVKRPHRNTN